MWKNAWFTPKPPGLAQKSNFSFLEHFFPDFSRKNSGFSCRHIKRSAFHDSRKLPRHLKSILIKSRSLGNMNNRMVYSQNHQIGSKIDFSILEYFFQSFSTKTSGFSCPRTKKSAFHDSRKFPRHLKSILKNLDLGEIRKTEWFTPKTIRLAQKSIRIRSTFSKVFRQKPVVSLPAHEKKCVSRLEKASKTSKKYF